MQDVGYPIEAENVAEMMRLIKQARVVTDVCGLFPEALDVVGKKKILDVACGPGEWVVSVAKKLPQSEVIGVDISELMIEYARFTAQEEGVSNTRFRIMDIRQPLDFPDASFDIIHGRFLFAFLTTSTWPRLMSEYMRLLRPGGVLCSVEADEIGFSAQPSFHRYSTLMTEMLRSDGHCFTSEGGRVGITAVQARLQAEAGFQNIQQQAYAVNFSAGMPGHEAWCSNCRTLMKLVLPIMVQRGLGTDVEINQLYERALEDMNDPRFCGIFFAQRTYGRKLG